MTNKHCASDVKFPKWVDDIEESVKSKAFTKDFVVMKWHLGLLGKKIVVWAWLTSPLQNQGKIFQSKTCFQKCLQQKIFYFCKVQLPMLISKVTSKEIKKDVQVIIEHILCLSCNLYSRDFLPNFKNIILDSIYMANCSLNFPWIEKVSYLGILLRIWNMKYMVILVIGYSGRFWSWLQHGSVDYKKSDKIYDLHFSLILRPWWGLFRFSYPLETFASLKLLKS